MSRVREDERGLYIRLNGHKNRPGAVRGYDHVYDMSDGGLKAGDTVKAYHVTETPLIKINLGHKKLYWHSRERIA